MYVVTNKSADGTGTAMTEEEVKAKNSTEKKALKEEIVAMAVLKQADKRRYGNLQISLKNSYLMGKNNYTDTIPDVLVVLNNYSTEWTQNKTQPPTPLEAPGTGGRNSAV